MRINDLAVSNHLPATYRDALRQAAMNGDCERIDYLTDELACVRPDLVVRRTECRAQFNSNRNTPRYGVPKGETR
jgi:hypothetical protein